MANRRMLDKLIFEDESFGSLSDKAQLLFIACVLNSDDDGKGSAHPANLRAYAFRYRDISTKEIQKIWDEITQKMRNLKSYIVDGNRYYKFEKWKQYQTIRVDRYKPSVIPDGNQMATSGIPTVSTEEVKLSEVKLSKDIYGEFVLLTVHEYERLMERFGDATQVWIDKLNNYIGSKGVKYKSHYHTILNWAGKEKLPEKKKADMSNCAALFEKKGGASV